MDLKKNLLSPVHFNELVNDFLIAGFSFKELKGEVVYNSDPETELASLSDDTNTHILF